MPEANEPIQNGQERVRNRTPETKRPFSDLEIQLIAALSKIVLLADHRPHAQTMLRLAISREPVGANRFKRLQLLVRFYQKKLPRELILQAKRDGLMLPRVNKTKIARLMAAGETAPDKIANRFGLSRGALANLKKTEEFRQQVEIWKEKLGDIAYRYPIARIEKQLAHYTDMLERGMTVILERAAAYGGVDADGKPLVPGGKSGLLVKQYKKLGKELVEEFAVDVALMAEMRATYKSVKELINPAPTPLTQVNVQINQVQESQKERLDEIAKVIDGWAVQAQLPPPKDEP